jgi:hypothetical protein
MGFSLALLSIADQWSWLDLGAGEAASDGNLERHQESSYVDT